MCKSTLNLFLTFLFITSLIIVTTAIIIENNRLLDFWITMCFFSFIGIFWTYGKD